MKNMKKRKRNLYAAAAVLLIGMMVFSGCGAPKAGGATGNGDMNKSGVTENAGTQSGTENTSGGASGSADQNTTGSAASGTNQNTSGGADSGKANNGASAEYIGMERAKEIALTHAGLSNTGFVDGDLDFEGGRAVYELDFEAGGMEYEYDIDAVTGEILKYHSERDDDYHPGSGR